jgi:hypothetical protein
MLFTESSSGTERNFDNVDLGGGDATGVLVKVLQSYVAKPILEVFNSI